MKLYRLFALSLFVLETGCKSSHPPVVDVDKPKFTPDVRVMDETLHSRVLARDMSVRLIVPAQHTSNASLPIVYLLHGAGVSFHDWTNNSQIASFAAKGVILVLPNMPGSYYINQLDSANNSYEDYVINELLPAVHAFVSYAATDRAHTAIVGISRGGYGAALLGLKHPQSFGFIGLMSPALDFAEREFRVTAPLESMHLHRVFGPIESETRKTNDPYVLIQKFEPDSAPFVFIGCSHNDNLASSVWEFVEILKSKKFRYEWTPVPGGHSWDAWNNMLAPLEVDLQKQFAIPVATRTAQ